jgi:coiled-coil domain-containing protein 6
VADPTAPSAEVMLEALRRENEQLRHRLVDTERDYIRVARVNEIYREELIELRR